MGLGAFTAILPSLWDGWFEGALAYRPLFALVGSSAAANVCLVARAHERYHRPKQDGRPVCRLSPVIYFPRTFQHRTLLPSSTG